jgi:hypothetical protein
MEPHGETMDADRILALSDRPGGPDAPLPNGAGLRVLVELHGARPKMMQETFVGDAKARIDIGGLDPARIRGARADSEGGTSRRRSERDSVPIHRLLLVERMQQNAWRGHATTRVEAGVALAVKRLFEDAPEPPAGTPEHALARTLLHLGYLEQVTATRRGAEALYEASLDACATAEGWTFLGWARAQQGRLEDAARDAGHYKLAVAAYRDALAKAEGADPRSRAVVLH